MFLSSPALIKCNEWYCHHIAHRYYFYAPVDRHRVSLSFTNQCWFAGPMRGGGRSAGTSVCGPLALAIDILFWFFHIFSVFRYVIWKFCCTGNKAFMKVCQWFYWTSNPQFWEKSRPVPGGPKAVLFRLTIFLLENYHLLLEVELNALSISAKYYLVISEFLVQHQNFHYPWKKKSQDRMLIVFRWKFQGKTSLSLISKNKQETKKTETFCTCECRHFNDWKEKEGKINLTKIELWMKLIAPPPQEVHFENLLFFLNLICKNK